MNILKFKQNETGINYNSVNAAVSKNKNLSSSFDTEKNNKVNNLPYYKDCFINKNFTASFKGAIDTTPKNKNELISSLSKTDKYSKEDINSILLMIDEIIENDEYEETDEKILIEMFDSLANSSKNSDINTMKQITSKICALEQDTDYIEINPICKGISAISQNIEAGDYKFDQIYYGNFDGFLCCDDTDKVYELCDLLKNSLKDTDPEKYSNLLIGLSKTINENGDNLQKELNKIHELSKKYKNSELLDGLLIHYNENIPLDEIPQKLELRKAVSTVYNNLSVSCMPDKNFFEKIYSRSIEELITRGKTPEEISDLLSFDDFCNKMTQVENIEQINSEIFADFIEDIPLNAEYYDEMKKYTAGSASFNRILNETGGDLSKVDKSKIYTTESGKQFSGAESISLIKLLTSFLDKCSTKRDLIVYRGTGCNILNQIETEDGVGIGNMIKEAVSNSDEEKLNEIAAQITGKSVVQHGFMSSALSIGSAERFVPYKGGIIWQINLPKGSDAIYADPYNVRHGIENEILVNRNKELLINNAEYKDGKFYISADIVQK